MFEIRVLRPQDWQLVRQVRLASLAESPHAFTSTHAREVAFDESAWQDRATTCRWFVAVEDGATIGVAGGLDGSTDDPGTRELVGMWVAPLHRGRGIARQLLDAVSDWARSDGASLLSLGVREGNDGAREAYLRLGMHPSGETVAERDQPDRSIQIMVVDLHTPRTGGSSEPSRHHRERRGR
jgi:GNAT superfamily N-acetyltransferase